jgi:hypothetical protein
MKMKGAGDSSGKDSRGLCKAHEQKAERAALTPQDWQVARRLKIEGGDDLLLGES